MLSVAFLVRSFVELGKLLLQQPGVKYLLSEKFSQDPLEEYFGRQRRSGGANENPTLNQFQQQHLALTVMRSELINDLSGNTQGTDRVQSTIDIHDKRKLPHKRR